MTMPTKRYTANQPVTREVDALIERYGARKVLEAIADYCHQNLGLRCFAGGFTRSAEELAGHVEVEE